METNNNNSTLLEIVTCAICADSYKDPRVLPCSHTFCYICLQKLCKHSKTDTVNCPKCRTVFQKILVEKLPKNLDLQEVVQHVEEPSLCKHHGETMKYWCKQCNELCCGTCMLVDGHKGHKYAEASKMTKMFQTKLKKDCKELKKTKKSFLEKKRQYLSNIEAQKEAYQMEQKKIEKKFAYLQRILDAARQSALQKLQSDIKEYENTLQNSQKAIIAHGKTLTQLNRQIDTATNSTNPIFVIQTSQTVSAEVESPKSDKLDWNITPFAPHQLKVKKIGMRLEKDLIKAIFDEGPSKNSSEQESAS